MILSLGKGAVRDENRGAVHCGAILAGVDFGVRIPVFFHPGKGMLIVGFPIAELESHDHVVLIPYDQIKEIVRYPFAGLITGDGTDNRIE